MIEVKVRVQNGTKHFEAREEILGEYFDTLDFLQKAKLLVGSTDDLRESLRPEIQKANERLGS